MSIKVYVFLVFGALILLLGGSQIFIAQFFKVQLQTELELSSRALSHNLVDVVIEQAGEWDDFSIDIPPIAEHVHQVEKLTEQIAGVDDAIMSLDDTIEIMETELEETIERSRRLDPADEAHKDELMRQGRELKVRVAELIAAEKQSIKAQRSDLIALKKQAAKEYQHKLKIALENIEISTDNWLDEGRVMIVKGSDRQPSRMSRNIDVTSQGAQAQLERFSDSMLLLIFGTCILALLLAYWLSHYVSEPLSQLSYGHKKLGEGRLGIELKEKGVKEIKQILVGFNAMSRQLAGWSEKEQLMVQQQHLADLGQITRGIAHSLRNPLHTLGLLADALSGEKDLQARQKMSSKIQQKISLMDRSIQSLLTLSSDAMNRESQIPLNEIIQDILLELSITGLKPKVLLPETMADIRIKGAESELRSIIHAVMINAVESQADTPKLAIDMGEIGQEYWLEVTDWGSGISPEVAKRLFEPHVTTKAEGSGMGVYIAKRLLQSHYAGELSYRANPEGGTIARISFAKEKLDRETADINGANR